MASQQTEDTRADARVRDLLDDLYERLEMAFYDIGEIAAAEAERVGADTPEGRAWAKFGGGKLTPAGRGLTAAMNAIAAVRGQLIYHRLDSSQVGHAAPDRRATGEERPDDADEGEGEDAEDLDAVDPGDD